MPGYLGRESRRDAVDGEQKKKPPKTTTHKINSVIRETEKGIKFNSDNGDFWLPKVAIYTQTDRFVEVLAWCNIEYEE